MTAAKQLASKVGIAAACRALGVPRSSFYAKRTSNSPKKTSRKSPPPRALSPEERELVLDVLNSPRFMDKSPWEIYPALLDDGIYLCSISTMYRILRAHDQVRERRNQRIHPHYVKPELVATAPNQVWSWDITRLPGLRSGEYHSLYVAIDLYSRYVVGWMVAGTESAHAASEFLRQTLVKHGIGPGDLTLHSDRGAAMTSQTVAQLLATLGIA